MKHIVSCDSLGQIEGFYADGVYKFLGIPYALAPLGKMTFKHSKRIYKLPTSPYLALSGKTNPVQGKGMLSVKNISLDCLYLNIFVPKTEKSKLPVLVWIYGGSFNSGGTGAKSSDTKELKYDGSTLAKDTESIVVTFNYRLNLYGFLNLNYLDDRFDINNGLIDQMNALEFVKDNIHFFDGDDENITVMGQSAGATSILALMSIYENQAPFNKAILLSAPVDHFFTEQESHKITERYLKYLKINPYHLDKLFSVSQEKIIKANQKLKSIVRLLGETRCCFSPIIDGKILKKHPKDIVPALKYPLLVSTMSNEANLFINDIPDALLPFLTKLYHFKIAKDERSFREKAYEGMTNFVYREPLFDIINNYSGPVYKYIFDYVASQYRKNNLPNFHAEDVPILFDMDTPFLSLDVTDKYFGNKLRYLIKYFIYNANAQFEEYHISNYEESFLEWSKKH